MSLNSDLELKEFNAASLTGSYQTFGAATSNPSYYAYFFNASDVDVYISRDGSTNDLRIPANSSLPLTYFSRHNTLTKGSSIFKKGTQLYVKQVTAAGTGTIIANIVTEQ